MLAHGISPLTAQEDRGMFVESSMYVAISTECRVSSVVKTEYVTESDMTIRKYRLLGITLHINAVVFKML